MSTPGMPRLPFFVYGTLRPGEHNHTWALAGRTVREEPATVRGLVLYEGPGYPYAVAGDGVVTGTLVEPDPGRYGEILHVLDELEDCVPGGTANVYERVTAEAERVGGGTERVWLYVAAPPLARRLCEEGTPIVSGDWLSRAR
ncbi:gamma-glutamylcyclotransferase family protein [Streptomyces sp. WMMC1477]|uniref:gamma-glutamylcyclotransferase family protein n=1 Tax=Streptomyces sp. WMMC1477 TaxID=3015155 RepID=UPI0022B70BF4|nr:gamma-glutamylcyclotransferase family protein [Streptomyces sp. WMMC1477]MCZ7431146.1 gamma-glutamylcyclotransferase [Streptomyces sp. WMMC1477]